MSGIKLFLRYLLLVYAVVFFTAAGELFAQQPAQTAKPADTTARTPTQRQPAKPADTTAGTPAQRHPAEPSAPAKLPPGLVTPPTEFNSQIGYNLKITVRISPVYEDSTLTSGVIANLPKGRPPVPGSTTRGAGNAVAAWAIVAP